MSYLHSSSTVIGQPSSSKAGSERIWCCDWVKFCARFLLHTQIVTYCFIKWVQLLSFMLFRNIFSIVVRSQFFEAIKIWRLIFTSFTKVKVIQSFLGPESVGIFIGSKVTIQSVNLWHLAQSQIWSINLYLSYLTFYHHMTGTQKIVSIMIWYGYFLIEWLLCNIMFLFVL